MGSSARSRLGPPDDRTADGDQLALAHGQFAGRLLDRFTEAQPAQQLADMAGDLLVVGAGEPQRQGHVLERAEMVEQAEILEHHADAPLQAAGLGPVELGGVAAEEVKVAAADRLGQRQDTQERGLAGTAGADEEVEAAGRQSQPDVVQHLGTVAVAHRDVVQLQDGGAVRVQWPRPSCVAC